jgi:DNA primase
LYQARQALRSGAPCVVVEGNFDVMSLHARGIKHVVAPLGTAFTEEQARAIRRFTQDVTLLFDGDSAGKRAVRASREPCKVAGLNAKVASLPDKMDPDELVRTEGPEAVERVLKAARGMLEYLIATTLERSYGADAQERIAIRRDVIELIREEPDRTARLLGQQYADRLAAAFNFRQDKELLDANALELSRAISRNDGDAPANGPQSVPRSDRARSREQAREVGLHILGAVFDFPELLSEPDAFEAAALLERDLALGLAAVRQAADGNSFVPEQVLAKLAPSIHPFALARLAAPQHQKLEDARTELVGNIAKLRKLEQKSETTAVIAVLEQADRQGNVEAQNDLLREKFENARRNLQRGRA